VTTDTGTGQLFRQVLGHFCTGVTVITTVDADGPAGFTCQSFAAVSLDPPLVLFCPGRSSATWPRISRAGHFCANVLADEQRELARVFAGRGPGGGARGAAGGAGKFDGVGWSPGLTGSPVLTGSLAVVECRLGDIFDGGDHELVTGRVVAMEVGEGSPLLFYRSGFGRFAS